MRTASRAARARASKLQPLSIVLRLVTGIAGLTAMVGCDSGPRERSAVPRAQGTAPSAAVVTQYPKGPWRLAKFDELDQAILFVSKISIRHRASEPEDGAVTRPTGWDFDASLPTRTREQALQLAGRVLATVRGEPRRFEEQARAHSDDLRTRERGGSLGGVRASQLPPLFLDGLQATGLGGTTGIIETPSGFHVLRWREPPAPQRVSGRHLVIGYREHDANESANRATRTRAEAERIARALLASPEPFVERIRSSSEAPDRARDGDLGVWSTAEPLHNGIELEALAEARMGEVVGPIDTALGVQLLQRTEPSARATYAGEALMVRYRDAEGANARDGRAAAEAEARALAAHLLLEPAAFATLKVQHGYVGSLQGTAGTQHPAIEAALAKLEIGAIAPEPVDLGWHYLILRRVVPSAPPRVHYTLPSPAGVDLDAVVYHSPPAAVIAQIDALKDAIKAGLSMDPDRDSKVQAALTSLQRALEAAPTADARVAATREALENLKRSLGQPQGRLFEQYLNAWARSVGMNESP